MRVRQSSGFDATNSVCRKDTGGQVVPVQNSMYGNVVESSRAGEIHQQAPRVKQEIVQNVRNNSQIQTKNRDLNHENRPELRFRGGKVAARKPEVFSESMNIDEWIESLKANLSGTNSNVATDQVLISQVKSFFSATALKRVKHIFRHDVCDWSQLKKLMELAFNRPGFKYETIHAKFLLREQHQDESFASFHEELWTLCDEMSAIRPIGDKDEKVNEMRVINQFAQGLHDRLVRRDVKRFVAQNRTNGLHCSMEVLEATTDAARECRYKKTI